LGFIHSKDDTGDRGAFLKKFFKIGAFRRPRPSLFVVDPAGEYCFYDFWNETFLGSKAGSEVLKQTLRPGEARMISVHRKTDHPQFLSTNRHVMQGYVELSQVRWKANVYSGVARVAADDPLRIVIATNGHEVERAEAGPGTCRVLPHADPGLLVLELCSPKTEEIDWSIEWKKS
jgi:hypothetical protein